MSIPQLVIATRFYTDAQVRELGFAQSLRAVVKEPSDLGIMERQLGMFWMSIADGAFTSGIVESSIRDPLIRYIHRMVSCTLFGHWAGAEKCNQLDLFCMYSMISHRPANLSWPETGRYSLDDMRLAGMCPMDDPARWEPARPAPEGPPDVEEL
ncbi:hypothetical protein R6Q57_001339 [Mikania cordata]